MQLHSDMKPISRLTNNAKQMVEFVAETGNTMVITQNGEAKAVVMNIREYYQMQQSLALLRMLADLCPRLWRRPVNRRGVSHSPVAPKKM